MLPKLCPIICFILVSLSFHVLLDSLLKCLSILIIIITQNLQLQRWHSLNASISSSYLRASNRGCIPGTSRNFLQIIPLIKIQNLAWKNISKFWSVISYFLCDTAAFLYIYHMLRNKKKVWYIWKGYTTKVIKI